VAWGYRDVLCIEPQLWSASPTCSGGEDSWLVRTNRYCQFGRIGVWGTVSPWRIPAGIGTRDPRMGFRLKRSAKSPYGKNPTVARFRQSRHPVVQQRAGPAWKHMGGQCPHTFGPEQLCRPQTSHQLTTSKKMKECPKRRLKASSNATYDRQDSGRQHAAGQANQDNGINCRASVDVDVKLALALVLCRQAFILVWKKVEAQIQANATKSCTNDQGH